MKKITLVFIPTIAISFLTNCGSSQPKKDVFTITSNLTHCISDKHLSTISVNQSIAFTLIADTNFKLPTDINVTGCEYTYVPTTGEVNIFNAMSDVVINVQADRVKFKVMSAVGGHVTFTDMYGETLNNKVFDSGESFQFKMLSNEGYKIPSELNIYLGNSETPLSTEYYQYINKTDTSATISVNSSKTIDDLRIVGKGVLINEYNYEVNGYGIDPSSETGSKECDQPLTITFTRQGTYSLPKKENVLLTIDGGSPIQPDGNIATYNESTGELVVKENKVVSNLTIQARAHDYPLLNTLSWKQIADISKAGQANRMFYIGEEKNIEVNNKQYPVRIIGMNQDKDKDDNTIGITFEFVNLISDSDGYSMASTWRRMPLGPSSPPVANHNYLDSSIRRTLAGEYQEEGAVVWAQKNPIDHQWSQDYTSPALDMLPSDLKSVLIAPKKTVQCYENDNWVDKDIINNKRQYDKLFLLSYEEVGGNSDRNGAYTYYQEPDESKLKALRIKKQISASEKSTEITSIYDTHCYFTYNLAGYNSKADNTGGGVAWLRTPNTTYNDIAWFIGDDGGLYGGRVYDYARSIAPAFCI